MSRKALIKRYEESKASKIALRELDISALAGYYLSNFQGDPIGALQFDMLNIVIPGVAGESAKKLIEAVILEDGGRLYVCNRG